MILGYLEIRENLKILVETSVKLKTNSSKKTRKSRYQTFLVSILFQIFCPLLSEQTDFWS